MSPHGAELDSVLRAAAVCHLGDASDGVGRSLDGSEGRALVDLAEGQGLLGALVDAVASGLIGLDDAAREQLAGRHEACMRWCLGIEVRLLEIGEWFDAVGGIRHVVLKGPSVAHLDEADPASRSFADLDLLVAAEDLGRAVDVLRRHGAVRPWAERRPHFDRRFAKSVTMMCPDGIEVDLHRTLVDGAHGVRVPVDELFGSTAVLTLGGAPVEVLGRPHRMLHAAYHAVLGSPTPRLASLRDLAGYFGAADLQPDRIAPTIARWRGEAVLATAIEATRAELGCEVDSWSSWLATTRIDDGERAIVSRQRLGGSSFGRHGVDVVRELPGWQTRAGYTLAALWPTDEHLRSRALRRRDLFAARSGRAPTMPD